MRDNNLILSAAQSVLSTCASTNIIDLLLQPNGANALTQYGQPGMAPKKFTFNVTVNTGITGGTAGTTFIFSLEDCLTTGAYLKVLSTKTFAKTALTTSALVALGYVIVRAPLPVPLRRYIRGYYTIALNATALSVFKVNTWMDVD